MDESNQADRTAGIGASVEQLAAIAIRGTAWTVGGYAAGQALRLVSTLVLARLLAPDAFGLWAIISVFLTGLQMFSDLGIGPSIIQNRRGDDPIFLATAWSLQIARGCGLWLASVALTRPMAALYSQPALTELIPIAALTALIAGFNGTAISTETRRVALGRLALLNLSADLLAVVATVVWAVLDPSVWALVAGALSAALIRAAGSHLLRPGRDRLGWDQEVARELFRFGAPLFFSTATYFMARSAEQMLLGLFVDIAVLGVYSLSLTIARAPQQAGILIAQRVLLPILSTAHRDGREKLLERHRRIRLQLLVPSAVGSCVVVACCPLFVDWALPERFAEARWILPALMVRASIQVSVTVSWMLLLAAGRTVYAAQANVLVAVGTAIGLPTALHIGGLGCAVVLLVILGLVPAAVYLRGIRRELPEASGLEWRATGYSIVGPLAGLWLALLVY